MAPPSASGDGSPRRTVRARGAWPAGDTNPPCGRRRRSFSGAACIFAWPKIEDTMNRGRHARSCPPCRRSHLPGRCLNRHRTVGLGSDEHDEHSRFLVRVKGRRTRLRFLCSFLPIPEVVNHMKYISEFSHKNKLGPID